MGISSIIVLELTFAKVAGKPGKYSYSYTCFEAMSSLNKALFVLRNELYMGRTF